MNMPPFNKFTAKAKEAIQKSHELAIERGQNHVSGMHVFASLLLQEESMVERILERLDMDAQALTDVVLDAIDSPESSRTLSPSYQIYLTPETAQILEHSMKIAAFLKDEHASTEHLFLAMLEVPGEVRDLLVKS